MERLGAIIAFLAVMTSGCVSTDPETLYTLNQRLLRLEGGGRTAVSGSEDSSSSRRQYDSLNYVVIYVPMEHGGYYPVRIEQMSANTFRGPRGELYYSFPTTEQLKRMYLQSAFSR